MFFDCGSTWESGGREGDEREREKECKLYGYGYSHTKWQWLSMIDCFPHLCSVFDSYQICTVRVSLCAYCVKLYPHCGKLHSQLRHSRTILCSNLSSYLNARNQYFVYAIAKPGRALTLCQYWYQLTTPSNEYQFFLIIVNIYCYQYHQLFNF